MWITDFFFRRHRRKTFGVFMAVGLPAVALVWLMQIAKPISHDDSLNVAAIALHDHYTVNPPYGVWVFDGVRITEGDRIVVDVNVTVIPHATFIETRNKRIRYSYMKLACPAKDAPVQKWLEGKKIWVNLNFHGKTLMEAVCPKDPQGGIFAS